MNLQRLKEAETRFLTMYPQGFETPELGEMVKKHRLDKLTAFARDAFAPNALRDVDKAAGDMAKLVSRSSLVSVFEKPKFRDAVAAMSSEEKETLVGLLDQLLYGVEAAGFDGLSSLLAMYQIDKWPVVTAFRCYCCPETDLAVKPTTVKNVISFFEIEGLRYTPHPVFTFYDGYRAAVGEMRAAVSARCGPTGAHFSGFLMMAMEGSI
jgi:hypothetical protein